LDSLGIVFKDKNNQLIIEGKKSKLKNSLLNCRESGSTLRFFIPVCMLFDLPVTLTGHPRLMERPLKEFLNALIDNGAEFEFDQNTLTVKRPIKAGKFYIPGNISSQFITGLLLTLPLLEGDSEIILTTPLESKAYVDLTIDVMEYFGVRIERVKDRFLVEGGQKYKPSQYEVESDFSAAAFFLAAGALGCNVSLRGLNFNSLQGDKEILNILKDCGVEVIIGQKDEIRVNADEIKPITIDVRDIPDLVPPITSLLCFAKGESKIVGAARLRMKESDRLHALATQFNKLGAEIIEEEDSLIIKGVKELEGGTVDPHNDHRIAMALAVASIKSKDTVRILNPNCVNKSYPNFWNVFCSERKEAHSE
jgi:3-phosphoshikimate 1-carboxyvinyltransferase